MEKPTIHLNGTSRETLRADLENAITAIRDARNLLAMAAPNARDYYVQTDGAFIRARNEHNDRDARLKSVADELMEIWEHVERDVCPRCGFENPMEAHDRLCPKRNP